MNSYEVIADLSIPLRFYGQQPNAFGVEIATARPLGDTRKGSSVNFEQYTFIPHCNGTHTECVGHITDERIAVRDCLNDVVITALLASVTPTERTGDLMIDVNHLREAGVRAGSRSLVLRTLPNPVDKMTRRYDDDNIPPYFTADAMSYIVDCGFEHLLVDLPSIDRLADNGKLENHRIFWNIEPGSRAVSASSRIHSTVTELIYVPKDVEDGEYLLNLQIAPFESDASPSRPILLRQSAAV